jgi:hypothetical protein
LSPHLRQRLLALLLLHGHKLTLLGQLDLEAPLLVLPAEPALGMQPAGNDC